MSKQSPDYNDYFNWRQPLKKMGYEVNMTLAEWCVWWEHSGKWKERGRGRHNYCMARIDIEKPFSIDNVECIMVKDKRYPYRGKQ